MRSITTTAVFCILFLTGISSAQDVWKINTRAHKREAYNASSLWVVNTTAPCPCEKDCSCTTGQCATGQCATKQAPQQMPDPPTTSYSSSYSSGTCSTGSCASGNCGGSSRGIFRRR